MFASKFTEGQLTDRRSLSKDRRWKESATQYSRKKDDGKTSWNVLWNTFKVQRSLTNSRRTIRPDTVESETASEFPAPSFMCACVCSGLHHPVGTHHYSLWSQNANLIAFICCHHCLFFFYTATFPNRLGRSGKVFQWDRVRWGDHGWEGYRRRWSDLITFSL